MRAMLDASNGLGTQCFNNGFPEFQCILFKKPEGNWNGDESLLHSLDSHHSSSANQRHLNAGTKLKLKA